MDNSCICTNGFIREYGLCVDCALNATTPASAKAIASTSAQPVLDQMVSQCNGVGLPVQPYTLAKNSATYLRGQGFAMGLTAFALGVALLV